MMTQTVTSNQGGTSLSKNMRAQNWAVYLHDALRVPLIRNNSPGSQPEFLPLLKLCSAGLRHALPCVL